jgi:hypothetical protein
MGSTTRVVHSGKLVAEEKIATVVLRLMMAMNDIAIVNDALQEWDKTEDKKRKLRKDGGKLYYGRMQSAHIYEALLTVDEIAKTPSLKAAVFHCGGKTTRSFETIAAVLDTDDYKMLCRIRNNASFHYDGKLAVRTLKQIVGKSPNDVSTCSHGNETLDWYFELGDRVLDYCLLRDIIQVDENADIRSAIDDVHVRLHVIAISFSDFAARFISYHTK